MNKLTLLASAVLFFSTAGKINAQIPCPAMVGYWETWSAGDMAAVDDRYNVIQVSFATPKSASNMVMEFRDISNPTDFKTKVKALQNKGKKVLVSVGGANDPIVLGTDKQKSDFTSSMDAIMSQYGFDGMDIDIESSSFDFGADWTMDAPAVGQKNWIASVKELNAKFKTRTGKKMILTAAPETVYLMGALSEWQISNVNGGAFLPILEGLKEEMDLLHVQYYNATENIAIDGKVHKEGDPNYTVAMTESIIKGFTLLKGKGTYKGFPAHKVAPGLVSCSGGGSGNITTAEINTALAYLKKGGTAPGAYTLKESGGYPQIAGLMVWSINTEVGCGHQVASAFKTSFPDSKDCTTDIVDSKNQLIKLDVFPNPTSLSVYVELDINKLSNKKLTLIDQLGNVVLTQNVSQNISKIDVSKLSKGFYFVTVGNATQKLVIN